MTKNMTKIKTKKINKPMRTVFARVSAVNNVNKDNDKLGVKNGDVVEYTLEDILDTIDKWQKTKKFDFYLIEHINDDGTNKHFHFVLSFPNKSSVTFKTLKNKFPYGDIETCKNVRSCVRYLTHIDEPEKKQYDWSDVITNNPERLERYKLNDDVFNVDTVVKMILKGEIKQFELDKIPFEVYSSGYYRINKAFEYVENRQITNPNRNIEIYVLQGSPRVGKTTFCKLFAEKNGKSICFSSSSRDPWQDYKGQDIFVYDDFEYSKIDIEDFKKALDPYTNTTMSRRYRNVLFTGDTIIICTNIPIAEWFQYSDDRSREAVFKRINYVLDFKSYDELTETTELSIVDISETSEYFEGASYFTINELVPTAEYKTTCDKYGNVADNYRIWDLKSTDGKLHEFNLKNYINTTDDEKKRADFIKFIEDI